MSGPRPGLGDSHNFGRRVERRGDWIVKPRTVVWEQLLLDASSPLRRFLDQAAEEDGLGAEAFAFLGDLEFESSSHLDGEVGEVRLEPLGALDRGGRRTLAAIAGRSLALWSWLGVADLHWENLALGLDGRGRIVFAPLDIEIILEDLSLPTETKLLPDADPEVAVICRHACGVRRLLPHLGKPVDPTDLVVMVSAYHETLSFLDGRGTQIADCFSDLPRLYEIPIRVCLRGTDEYVRSSSEPIWPPLLEAEEAQLERGDVPYFFRLVGWEGIHYYEDASLEKVGQLPLEGDVPVLEPLLGLEDGLRSPNRRSLREEGLFVLLGAFDHRSFRGTFREGGFDVTFEKEALVVGLPSGDEYEIPRDLRDFVGSVYLRCRCGEVASVLVPPVTVCS